MQRTHRPGRVVVALGAIALGATACDSLLEVENPTAITDDNLTGDQQTVVFMARGVQGEVRGQYIWVATMGAAFTDEGMSGHPWQPWNAYDQRTVPPENGAHAGFTYGLLQRARGTADALIPQMREALGDEATSSADLAYALTYAGYAYVLMADHLCSAPIETLGSPVEPAAMYQEAVTRFTEAEQIATAASDDDMVNLSRVGLARAELNLGNHSAAIAAAGGVPSSFEAWFQYVPEGSLGGWRIYNFLDWWAGDKAAELDLAYDPAALITDDRIPYNPVLETISDGRRQGHRPYQTSSYSEWTGSPGVMFDEGTDVRFASGLEAEYMIAEASLGGGSGGMSTGEIVTFLDARRAVGGQGAYTGGTSTDELRLELIDQRRRDFFLAGYRVGDLRRYERLYGTSYDFWPTGVMPGLTQQYGNDKCWPMDINELNGNPNAR